MDSINNPSQAESFVILEAPGAGGDSRPAPGELGLNPSLGWSEIEGKESVEDQLP